MDLRFSYQSTMKRKILPSSLLLGLFSLGCVLSGQNPPVILPTDDPDIGPPLRVVWPTEPGVRYLLEESTTLESGSWSVVGGFPTEAAALAQQHAFDLSSDRQFFRVVELDEQPPEVVDYSPGDGAFGVGRFSSISVELEDRTGIDAASISFSVQSGASIGTADPSLTFEDGVLTFDLGGDTPLGAYGETVEFQLTVADSLGNTETYQWSMELERLVQTASDLLVFGSPDAQRAGQRLSGMAATVAARFGGPVRASATSLDWEIDSVTADTILIAYTSASAPTFTVGQKVTNLAPAHVDEIFYREITSVSVDTGAQTVTLGTVDLNLGDIMPEGSFTFGQDAEILEFDASGNLVAMRSLTVNLPSIGADFSGQTVYDSGPLAVTLPEARALFHPSVTLSLDMESGEVERFAARAEGDFDIAVVPQLTVSSGFSQEVSQELWSHGFWVWTTVGFVPVGVEVGASITANASIEVDAQATFQTGFRQTASMGMEGVYLKDATPSVEWDRWFTIDPIDLVPFTYTLNGEGSASVSLVPQIDVRLYGAAGLYLNMDPRLTLSGSATVTDGTLTEASWLFGAYADVNAGLSVIGLSNDQLPALPPFRFFTREWGDSYAVDPDTPGGGDEVSLAILRQPLSQNAKVGDTVVFAVEADGSGSLDYQWYHNGVPLPGATGRELRLPRITSGFAGDYFVRVRDANGTLDSVMVSLSIIASGTTGPAPSGFAYIPAGSFEMGDSFSEGSSAERPVHSVYLSGFYMGRTEVTYSQWQTVYNWAVANGYNFDNTGAGKAANHPVHTVSWYDVVKWCNAASERERLAPVYRTGDGSVYRTGRLAPVIDYGNRGYRLPTEAEWEKAARGGLSGKRFPWGNTITHSEANYYSRSGYSYDVSSTRGYHPSYDDGNYPYTSPVGSFAANGYGLYDMAGNVWEWCNDWYGSSYYGSSPGTDPTGPTSGSARVVRGGGWYGFASNCRAAYRSRGNPDFDNYGLGFRLARSQ